MKRLKKARLLQKLLNAQIQLFLLPVEKFENDYFTDDKPKLGFNFSPLCISKFSQENQDKIINNVVSALNNVLDTTDYSILLIPHVLKPHNNHMKILTKIFKDLNNPRVQLVDIPKINAKQIKYLISQCDIMVASRTHASIAAYSAYVPTLVIGYSIKSKGIATDLFGTGRNYVLPSSDLFDNDVLYYLISFVVNNGDNIHNKLKKIYLTILTML